MVGAGPKPGVGLGSQDSGPNLSEWTERHSWGRQWESRKDEA